MADGTSDYAEKVGDTQTIWTNYIKAKILNTLQNSKCSLCNQVQSEWNKLAQKKYKTQHGYVGKVVHCI